VLLTDSFDDLVSDDRTNGADSRISTNYILRCQDLPQQRLYSVMVSTSDSDSGNPSSIPGTTFFFWPFEHFFCLPCASSEPEVTDYCFWSPSRRSSVAAVSSSKSPRQMTAAKS
jgi:hypothetical protein